MANGMDRGSRVISGSHGTVWLDNEQVGECFGMNSKVAMTKEDVPMCGQFMVDSKTMSAKGTGTLKLYHTTSRIKFLLAEKIKNGADPRFKVVSKLDDPDSYGAESIVIYDASFDDLTLADWEAAKKGQIETPFTFTRYDILDTIEVQ